ncbi:unnamed protein product [Sphagnum tenellum]
MWADYSRYYFGDFASSNNAAFMDDIITDWKDPNNSDFGFTSKNGGNVGANSQWYFKSIDILHLHNQVYDLYSLINPRIASFSPDELDFEQSAVAMINAEFIYEALIFTPNVSGAAALPEFAATQTTGHSFNGESDFTGVNYGSTSAGSPPSYNDPASPLASSISQGVEQYFGSSNNPLSAASTNSNYFNTPSTGGLGIFGNFIFGQNQSAGTALLSTLVASNPVLAATLGIGGNQGNPLAINAPLNIYGATSGYVGVPTQFPGVASSVGANMSSNYGSTLQTMAQGVLASALASGSSSALGLGGGVSLAPGAYGVINAQRPGSAQWGYNPSTTNTGQTYGYQGASGVTGPVGINTTNIVPVINFGGSQQVAQVSSNPNQIVTQSPLPTADTINVIQPIPSSSTVIPSASQTAVDLPTPPVPPAAPPATTDNSDPTAGDSDLDSGVSYDTT